MKLKITSPNLIDESSLLELQSADKVFVLTRVNNTQMNGITPLEGAMAYNIDQNCVFQYDGTNWISLCEQAITFIIDNNDGSFTYTNEDNVAVTITKAQLTDNGNGTYTFDNGNGTPINFVGTDDQIATEVAYDNGASGLLATDVQAAIDEINTATSNVNLMEPILILMKQELLKLLILMLLLTLITIPHLDF